MNDFRILTDQLDRFPDLVLQRAKDVFVGSHGDALASMTDGSPITGAPGQPVEFGALKGSWPAGSRFTGEWTSEITTNLEYAEAVEEGIQQPYTTASGTRVTPRAMHFKSPVGGAHSLKLTIAGWPALVEARRRMVVGL